MVQFAYGVATRTYDCALCRPWSFQVLDFREWSRAMVWQARVHVRLFGFVNELLAGPNGVNSKLIIHEII